MDHYSVQIHCHLCGKSFQNRSGLTQHRNSTHAQPPTGPAARDHEDPVDPLQVQHADNGDNAFPNEMPARRVEDRQGEPAAAPVRWTRRLHPALNALPCTRDGSKFLELGAPPPPRDKPTKGDWAPFGSRLQFEVAEFLYKKNQMSQRDINTLMDLWAASLVEYGGQPPFANSANLLDTIDAIALGDAPWSKIELSYQGPQPEGDVPSWMTETYVIWKRDTRTVVHSLIDCEDYNGDGEFNLVPYQEVNGQGGRRLTNVLSGNWAWRQADRIAEDPTTHGSMFVPIIVGSDKTTVSVATGQNEYYPLYVSIGNVSNSVRRAHRNAVRIVAFLAIAKCEKKDKNSTAFRTFKRQLYHASVSIVLGPLRPAMSTPEVVRCPDGHFRRTIYQVGPNLMDYPEQALAACIVEGWCPVCPGHCHHLDDGFTQGRRSQELTEELVRRLDAKQLWEEYGIVANVIPYTNDFPRADIHEILSGDLLHQLIKPFKDHGVDWTIEYLKIEYGEARAAEILDEIDRRIAAMPPFVGLRHFHQGRNFKQWTGDDSRALMKIWLAAIKGLVPREIVCMTREYLEFAYRIRHPIQTDTKLDECEAHLAQYHHHREFLRHAGVRPEGFSIPRQHSHGHMPRHTWNFGALYGLCTSLTESKHIKAVKEPWRRSNRYRALGQMLTTNQRLDKLAAARVDFAARGMLEGTCLPAGPGAADDAQNNVNRADGRVAGADDDDDDEGVVEGPPVEAFVVLARQRAKGYPKLLGDLSAHISRPEFTTCIGHFLAQQLHEDPEDEDVLATYTLPNLRLSVYPSAVATFYAPADPSGPGGMRRERIRATPSWRSEGARYDCAYIVKDSAQEGFRGLDAVRIRLLFSFKFNGILYPCALVEWFEPIGDEPDEETGMWMVEPELDADARRPCQVVHLDSIFRAAHLLPVYGEDPLPIGFRAQDSLDAFRAYLVSKYVDYHAHEHVF
ncbi:uncharacterized protein C8Q71DRAFT_698981 [Rhodofomes roseus]|uniref:C2H2-type domain-containing protein n=1 Tax=Rhodofomes roseus TaxID=34475 RepID=A0ABQ8KWQ2_9APHY|nr:uncharacterized protein C8Q71DRAFT_698981 [Rhodofomes roseus]KAH9842964.1 hypothetical protein C8Q71DRAFT_698981 [Rhodofomes roseus]